MFLLDTNVLLKYPSVLTTLKNIVINIRTIEELDGLKKNHNPEIAYEARRASHKIFQRYDDITFNMDRDDSLTVDDNLIQIAKTHNDILVSNDLNVIIKAKMKDVICQTYDKVDIDYTGVRYLTVKFDKNLYNEEVDSILNTGETPFPMEENEFLIIKNEEDDSIFCSAIYKEGKLNILHENSIKNRYVNKIKPRNVEQNCLMDLLYQKDISIIAATGKYGTGKSFLLTNFALQELDAGRISKIVYVPNNSIVENSRELGILPGDAIDKELVYMGPILDLVGEDRARDMIYSGQIEVVPISVMRGRSFVDSIIIVNEAQNLTTEHIKLLVARCGEDSRIFFDGDIKQSDSFVFKNKSGLKLLLYLSQSKDYAPIFGTVNLRSIERSKTAQASEYLENLLI